MFTTIRNTLFAGIAATMLAVTPTSATADDHWDNHGRYWNNYWNDYSNYERRGRRHHYNRGRADWPYYYNRRSWGNPYSRNYYYRSPGYQWGNSGNYFYYSPNRGFGFGWR